MVKLSIVIPYYNTYELTEKLLNKLEEQLTDETEVFVIDDGCNEKRLDDFKMFNIIHLDENVGCGIARNIGIRKAIGKYIAFIDSDDLVADDYIKTLINTIDNRDEQLIYYNWQDMNTNEIIRMPSNPAVWKCIYKRDIIPMFIEEKNLVHEDVYFNEEIDKNNFSRYYIDKVLYLYNSNRIGSLTWELNNR